MKNIHITRFGDPLSRNGARYGILDIEGVNQLLIDMEISKQRLRGLIIQVIDTQAIIENIARLQMEYHQNISQEGIPQNISQLLNISNKSDIKRYCKKLTISENELYLLIHNCSQANYSHYSKFKDYVPKHLEITNEDREMIKKGILAKVSRKFTSLFKQRRHIHAHIFIRGTEWHCFYFSYTDIEIEDKNHWINGGHLHYVNHLWPQLSVKSVWKAFNIRKTELPGDIHIRFLPNDYSDERIHDDSILEFATLQVTTRGFCVLDAIPSIYY